MTRSDHDAGLFDFLHQTVSTFQTKYFNGFVLSSQATHFEAETLYFRRRCLFDNSFESVDVVVVDVVVDIVVDDVVVVAVIVDQS